MVIIRYRVSVMMLDECRRHNEILRGSGVVSTKLVAMVRVACYFRSVGVSCKVIV